MLFVTCMYFVRPDQLHWFTEGNEDNAVLPLPSPDLNLDWSAGMTMKCIVHYSVVVLHVYLHQHFDTAGKEEERPKTTSLSWFWQK